MGASALATGRSRVPAGELWPLGEGSSAVGFSAAPRAVALARVKGLLLFVLASELPFPIFLLLTGHLPDPLLADCAAAIALFDSTRIYLLCDPINPSPDGERAKIRTAALWKGTRIHSLAIAAGRRTQCASQVKELRGEQKSHKGLLQCSELPRKACIAKILKGAMPEDSKFQFRTDKRTGGRGGNASGAEWASQEASSSSALGCPSMPTTRRRASEPSGAPPHGIAGVGDVHTARRTSQDMTPKRPT